MLLVLTVGASGLAVTKLAAWWVILPPTVMLGGYLLLLREGAKADSERREQDRIREARLAARSAPVVPPVPVPVPVPVPAPDAEIIKMPSARIGVGQEFFDQNADVKRAVGG